MPDSLDYRAEIIRLCKQERDNKTPYVYGGQLLGLSLDCSGLVIAVFTELCLINPGTDLSANDLYRRALPLRLRDLRGGDLVFYTSRRNYLTSHDPRISHVAVYIGNDLDHRPHVIHASGGDETCTSIDIARKRGARVKQTLISHHPYLIGFGSIDPWLPD
jgi:cell wall-associated NlpC family hydrolase